MKKIFVFISIFTIALLSFAQAEPDFELEPYVFTSDSTFEIPLPCESAYIKAKAGASMYLTGIGKVKSYYYINGVASPLNIDKNTENIIINTGGTSPQQTLSVIKLETLQSKRRWKSGEIGSFTGASANEDASVVLKYKKYGESSVIISTKGLEDGEYCLAITNMMTNTKSAKVYTFRIGEGAKEKTLVQIDGNEILRQLQFPFNAIIEKKNGFDIDVTIHSMEKDVIQYQLHSESQGKMHTMETSQIKGIKFTWDDVVYQPSLPCEVVIVVGNSPVSATLHSIGENEVRYIVKGKVYTKKFHGINEIRYLVPNSAETFNCKMYYCEKNSFSSFGENKKGDDMYGY